MNKKEKNNIKKQILRKVFDLSGDKEYHIHLFHTELKEDKNGKPHILPMYHLWGKAEEEMKKIGGRKLGKRCYKFFIIPLLVDKYSLL